MITDARPDGPLAALWQGVIDAHFLVSLAQHEVVPALTDWRTFVEGFNAHLAGQVEHSREPGTSEWMIIDHLQTLLKAELRWLDSTITVLSDTGTRRQKASGAE